MKKLALVLILVLLLVACGRNIKGSGNIVTETYSLRDFDKIDFSGAAEMTIIQGRESAVTLTTDDNIVDQYEVKVRRDTLIINPKPNRNFRPTDKILFEVTVDDLERIDQSGATDITTELSMDDLDIDVSGASNFTLVGSGETIDLDVSGASYFNGKDYRVENLDADVSGASNATVWVTEILEATASGASDIDYYGNPTDFELDASGASDIDDLGEKGGR